MWGWGLGLGFFPNPSRPGKIALKLASELEALVQFAAKGRIRAYRHYVQINIRITYATESKIPNPSTKFSGSTIRKDCKTERQAIPKYRYCPDC